MKNPGLLKSIIYVIILAWVGMTVAGCSQTNSLSSNPVAAEVDPESNLSIGDSTSKGENFAPVVNLFADKSVVGTDAEVVIRAETLDPEGAQVEIAWNADSGNLISTADSRAVWQAPAVGTQATISCSATDPHGLVTKAEVKVEVLANGTYRLMVVADRSALPTGKVYSNSNDLYVPVSGARVEMPQLGLVGVTDSSGSVQFNIDQTDAVATATFAKVKHLDWEVNYIASLKPSAGVSSVMDSLSFAPGFDGVSVAVGRGDSFSLKRGAIEVMAVENTYGEFKPVAEVTVDAGSVQSVSAAGTGIALVNSISASNGEINLRLTKNGYQTIDGYRIPVALDGLTLVRARLDQSGKIPDTDAIISYTRPYNYQNSFPVSGPFEIGFGQAMEKETFFDDISLMIQNKSNGATLAMTGSEIKNHFRVEWSGNTAVRLYPRQPLQGLTRYSLLISRLTARAVDGRMLKNYNGMYGEFVTEADAVPRILSTSPVNGATDVGRTGPFVVRFDRSMMPESLYDNLEIEITNLQSNSRIVVDGASLKSHFSVVWKEANTVLELVPYRMLAVDNPYLIRLNRCGLVSVSGKSAEGFQNLWGQFKTGKL